LFVAEELKEQKNTKRNQTTSGTRALNKTAHRTVSRSRYSLSMSLNLYHLDLGRSTSTKQLCVLTTLHIEQTCRTLTCVLAGTCYHSIYRLAKLAIHPSLSINQTNVVHLSFYEVWSIDHSMTWYLSSGEGTHSEGVA